MHIMFRCIDAYAYMLHTRIQTYTHAYMYVYVCISLPLSLHTYIYIWSFAKSRGLCTPCAGNRFAAPFLAQAHTARCAQWCLAQAIC